MKIKVKNLVANPYRNIKAYPIDQEKIRQLRNSIKETTFWDNILARSAHGKQQIAYGHHRLIAIREELGEDTVVDIPVRDLSDENMLKIMANENMREWSTDLRVVMETVRAAKKFLEEHPEIIAQYRDPRGSQELGASVISRFLGRNWSKARVEGILRMVKDKEIQFLCFGTKKKELPATESLEKISSIKDIKAKKYWIKEVAEKDITHLEMQEIARFENDPILSKDDKEILRENILEGRIRGKKQIRNQVEFIKVRKLHEAKKTDEDKRKEDLKDFLNKADALAVGLKNKLVVLTLQFKEHPETKKYLPQYETLKLQGSLTDLLLTIKELIDATKIKTKKNSKEALT